MARKHVNAILETLYTLGQKNNVKVTEPAPGHFQLRGALLVNYYPLSKKQTAYVAGTKEGRHGISPLQAIDMANTPPPIVPPMARDPRQGKLSRERRRWLIEVKGVTTCHWCKCSLTLETSTLEHIISLARGGLDQPNNWTLACYPCNRDRGHDMPELTSSTKVEEPSPEFLQSIANLQLTEPQRRMAQGIKDRMACLGAMEDGPRKAKLVRSIRKAEQALLNDLGGIHEKATTRYHATFQSVARDVLPADLYLQVEREYLRRKNLTTTGDTLNGLHRSRDSSEPKPERRSADDLAAPLLASHPRRSNDAPSIQPECVE